MRALEFRDADCFDFGDAAGCTVHPIRPEGMEALDGLDPAAAAFVRATKFRAQAGEVLLIPGTDGPDAVLGLGTDPGPFAYGALPSSLPPARTWRVVGGDQAQAALGFAMGAYRQTAFRTGEVPPLARLTVSRGATVEARRTADAIWFARDLINAPANVLGPAELADAAAALGARHGAAVRRVSGEAVAEGYPALAAVGRGSDRAPEVVRLDWTGPGGETGPHVVLCGKGVCFDTGGYDIKPSAAMLRMKKDMGGAAVVLGTAGALMGAGLAMRLSVLVGCVENSISGRAMRPLDVLHTRAGLRVEVGNTDAEGRLVLADLLAEACADKPDVVIDAATLTGAARTALGPEIVAMFANDDGWAARLSRAGSQTSDFIWRLPLHTGYRSWLDSPTADLNTVSGKPFAGAIVAALFLERFVTAGQNWVHLDLFAQNDGGRPGRPEGGEATGLRALEAAIREFVMVADRTLARTNPQGG